MAKIQIVVGIEEVGEHDWFDAYGHYWAWDEAQDLWHHDRQRCRLDSGRACVRGSR